MILPTSIERFSIVNLGCKVNRVESDTLAERLLGRGLQSVPAPEADLVIINTCTVTGEAEKKTRKAVRKALKDAPNATIVVTGCAATMDPSFYEALDERVSVIPKGDLLENSFLPKTPGTMRMGAGFPTRVGIKAQDGCDNACTYCIVHVARGPARSTPFDEVVSECERYLQHGVKELVLTGIDLGRYQWEGRGLADLLSALLEASSQLATAGEHPCRFRLSSVEPLSLSEPLIELMAASEGLLCRHLHLPLQSGSSSVLAAMGRPYSRERFLALTAELYERIPSLSLTTDIICGFPGETDDDFACTLSAAREARFSKIHVFPYSRRPGTPAARRPDQIDPALKRQRTSELRKLADELRQDDFNRRRGSTELCLVEPDRALTESYHELPVDTAWAIGTLQKTLVH